MCIHIPEILFFKKKLEVNTHLTVISTLQTFFLVQKNYSVISCIIHLVIQIQDMDRPLQRTLHAIL